MMPNPGYQRTQDFNPQMGQQVPRNPNPQADELLLKVTEMTKNQFGLKPKGLTFSYKRPYPEWYDLVALPTNYRLLEFTKFTGQDSTSTIEHVSWYLTQLGEASVEDAHRVVSSPCLCHGRPSLGSRHYQSTPLPIGPT